MSSPTKRRRRRIIKGLRWAKALECQPPFIHEKKVRGSRKAGLIYERKVANYLEALYPGRVRHGQWFEFEDHRGKGWCQTDVLVMPVEDGPLILIEIKLSHRPAAERKLKAMYLPVVLAVWPDTPIVRIQVCKNLTKGFDDVLIDTLDDVFDPDFPLEYATWNLRGIPTI